MTERRSQHETPNAIDNGACVQPASGEVAEAEPAPTWGYAKTVGNAIAQLKTMDATLPFYAALHLQDGRCIARGVTFSRERVVNERWIDNRNKDVPYSIVVWSQPVESLYAAAPASPRAPAPQAVVSIDTLREMVGELKRGYEKAATISGSAFVDGDKKARHDAPAIYSLACEVLVILGYAANTANDWLTSAGQQPSAPSAAPHQGADALREADVQRIRDALLAAHDEFTTNDAHCKADEMNLAISALDALAHHQAPQQGEQHE